MGFRVNRTVGWDAGPGTPEKYRFYIDVEINVVSVQNNIATISMVGTYGVQNNPTNSRNSFAASDFAALSKGDVDPWNYPFIYGTSYYQEALPFATNAPQSVRDGILVEFRGDTWRNDPVDSDNRSTLYYKPSGVVLNTYNGSTYQSFNANTTFTVDISAGGDVPLLTWVASGADSSTDYEWLEHEVWASWFDLDYRPGATLNTNSNIWFSNNKMNGACHVLSNVSNMTWQECRTIGGAEGQKGTPPLILTAATANSWRNQKKLGKE